MPQEFLHRSYTVPALEQVSRKGMPECVVSGEACILHERPLMGR